MRLPGGQSEPAEPESAELDSMRKSLGSLCSALIRLDHDSAQAWCSSLAEISPEPRAGSLQPEEAAELHSRLQFALALTRNARALYAGWARLAGIQGAGYTPAGEESVIGTATSMVLDG